MEYNIFDRVAPAMPSPSRGTEICKLLLSQASKDMHETLVPMALPALAAHLAARNFCIPTSVGRNYAPKWPIWLQKVGVTRGNCPIL